MVVATLTIASAAAQAQEPTVYAGGTAGLLIQTHADSERLGAWQLYLSQNPAPEHRATRALVTLKRDADPDAESQRDRSRTALLGHIRR